MQRAFLLALFTLACGESGPSDLTRADVAGTYSLRTVNGQPLPYTADGYTQISATLHLTELASASFLEYTNALPGQNPIAALQDIGWSPVGTDSIVVNYLFPASLQVHGGHVRGDTISLRPLDTVVTPDRLEVYVRE